MGPIYLAIAHEIRQELHGIITTRRKKMMQGNDSVQWIMGRSNTNLTYHFMMGNGLGENQAVHVLGPSQNRIHSGSVVVQELGELAVQI